MLYVCFFYFNEFISVSVYRAISNQTYMGFILTTCLLLSPWRLRFCVCTLILFSKATHERSVKHRTPVRLRDRRRKEEDKKHHMKQSLLMEFGVIWCQGESTGRGFVICLSFPHTYSHTHSCLRRLWKMWPAEWKRNSFGSRSLHAFLL